ncbi:hypothetical protein TSUD_230960 [Trifolium subterraneum]|nr:hypothetical protein TSUD_230960 [Trifolium subterraneum]
MAAKNVGILALDIYFPPNAVQQEALEAHDGASKGKYTIGLGQDCILTVVSTLLEKYGIDPKQIGRLEVGSETVIDKSKSIKTFLMQIFEVVDGKLSQTCYLMALDTCYKNFCQKYEKHEGKPFALSDADYFVFHSPYNKLVQKSFARLVFSDFLRNPSSKDEVTKEKLGPFATLSDDESYQSRDLEKASQQVAKPLYDEKVQPSTLIPKQVGNMYTASIYAAFASLIHNKHSSLEGKRVILFSYGSGLTSTMFSLQLRETKHPFSLSNIAQVMDVAEKLKSRQEFPPEKFIETLKLMEHRYGAKDYVTSKDSSLLAPGTFYLTEVDTMYRRFYATKSSESNSTHAVNGVISNGH